MVSSQIKAIVWGIWLLIFPAGLLITYYFFPPQIAGQGINLFAFFILMFFVSVMPMVVNNTPIFLLQWVSMAVFLTFGLLVEMVMVQLAVIILLMKLKLQKHEFFRLPLNSLMFFAVSLASGLAYFAMGGKTGIDVIANPQYFWVAAAYPLIHFTLNQLLLSLIQYTVYGRKSSFFEKDLVWELVTSLITFPIGLVLYILYLEVGLLALLFVGVPFVSLSIILHLYYSSEKINDYLQKAAEIGHQMAERLYVNEVMDLFILKLNEMLPVDNAYILDIVDENALQLIYRVENGQKKELDLKPLKKNEGISGRVWFTRKSALFHSKKEWKSVAKEFLPDGAESIISVPIVRSNEVIGVLLLSSNKKRAYEKSQLMIVDILCSHFAIAIENAKHHEETKAKSERCALTKLYNYRYIENKLSEEFSRMQKGEKDLLSLIILDIDHFKQVNDTYGHQSGNEILCELANRLTNIMGNEGIVARYGGEEFVILLPDANKEAAMKWAELVRQTIANRPFNLRHHMDKSSRSRTVHITASIGVASAPMDADDSLALIRHADRALYIGAKRAGRNRVAEYVK
ncbi:sensor domain-containing diguanylate cyclase [Bacillus sp. ISL-47]|uniref:sensor domain-containing diguanylate cyclase n=1 Tax=Bacillus sp. ISL-47 TaxID=2819130 RepID=UPI001BE753E2|nr:sensor domain-containing diguanylate cyclase [Bacillus sp. ISL-47]MBT2707643.1 GGDEF domain-containing protein [Pseudomonas sp. ISL-84]